MKFRTENEFTPVSYTHLGDSRVTIYLFTKIDDKNMQRYGKICQNK